MALPSLAAQGGQAGLHGLDVLLLINSSRRSQVLGLRQSVCDFTGCFTQGPCKQTT